MKTAAKILLLASVVFVFAMMGLAYAQEVEVLHGIVYCETNFFLHDDDETPLHTRIAADNSWTNGMTVEGTNDIDEVAVLKIHHEGWQGQLAIYDPSNSFYRIFPYNGTVYGFVDGEATNALWNEVNGDWIGGYSNTSRTVYMSNAFMRGNLNMGGNGVSNLYLDGGAMFSNGNYTVNNGTLGVWSNGTAEVRIGVVEELTNVVPWIAFENPVGFGTLAYKDDGDAGEFILCNGVPNAWEWANGNYTLRVLQANLKPNWIALGTNAAISNWPVRIVEAPPTSTNAGTVGMMAWTNGEFYLCVSNATWRRVGMTNW